MCENQADKTLNWVLAAYQDANVRPGVVADAVAARRTIEQLNNRAIRRAASLGIKDESIGKDAVGAMFEALGRSRILETFDATVSGPRGYINAILDRFVLRNVSNFRDGQTVPLSSDVKDDGCGPARLAEIAELASMSAERTSGLPGNEELPDSLRTSKSHGYVRRHRARMRKWQAVADLFPNVSFRPRRRRRTFRGGLTPRRVATGRSRTTR